MENKKLLYNTRTNSIMLGNLEGCSQWIVLAEYCTEIESEIFLIYFNSKKIKSTLNRVKKALSELKSFQTSLMERNFNIEKLNK